MKSSIFLLWLVFSFSLVNAGLYLKEAGVGGEDGPHLQDDFRICPFSGRNFSVICRPTIPDPYAVVFYVNDKPVRRETVAPYAIAGDNPRTGRFNEWFPPPPVGNMVKIACAVFRANEVWAENIIASGRFDCPDTSSRNKISLQIIQAKNRGPSKKNAVTLVEGFNFCPKSYAPNGISISCVPPIGSNATHGIFEVNARQVRREGVLPYTIAGDDSGYANPWTPPSGVVSITCRTDANSITVKGTFECPVVTPQAAISVAAVPPPEKPMVILPRKTSPEPTPTRPVSVAPAPPVEVNASHCVTWDATSHVNIRDPLWVANSTTNSLTYRPLDTCSTCTYPEDTAPLVYKFKVNVISRFAITMDSTTPHVTEHNDCWFRFQSLSLYGFSAENSSEVSTINGLNSSLKAYQNSAGRAKAAFSVDHNIHSFATTQMLTPGTEYTFTIFARSTQFTLNGIIMFPCLDDNCWHYSPHFLTYLNTCNIPSASVSR